MHIEKEWRRNKRLPMTPPRNIKELRDDITFCLALGGWLIISRIDFANPTESHQVFSNMIIAVIIVTVIIVKWWNFKKRANQ
ncbi:hypothetical protein [Schleiferilactobacillus perolens]|uniref:Uncharacterized protein n=1 Tax=Schleiferilactobacillus perolens DSM 12744 TaxID=1423792 RepID=A0A0R1N283_9LACO|nr:hypothetical protein [Schleiferilactobacillus perolens]KRL12452.1 hypothetical protein FD09_GL003038 [Schleiferilactobacillus perolens DSM 12744]